MVYIGLCDSATNGGKSKRSDSQLEWGSKEVGIRIPQGDRMTFKSLFSGYAITSGVWRFVFWPLIAEVAGFCRGEIRGILSQMWLESIPDAS